MAGEPPGRTRVPLSSLPKLVSYCGGSGHLPPQLGSRLPRTRVPQTQRSEPTPPNSQTTSPSSPRSWHLPPCSGDPRPSQPRGSGCARGRAGPGGEAGPAGGGGGGGGSAASPAAAAAAAKGSFQEVAILDPFSRSRPGGARPAAGLSLSRPRRSLQPARPARSSPWRLLTWNASR